MSLIRRSNRAPKPRDYLDPSPPRRRQPAFTIYTEPPEDLNTYQDLGSSSYLGSGFDLDDGSYLGSGSDLGDGSDLDNEGLNKDLDEDLDEDEALNKQLYEGLPLYQS